jgi:hypothetical protein
MHRASSVLAAIAACALAACGDSADRSSDRSPFDVDWSWSVEEDYAGYDDTRGLDMGEQSARWWGSEADAVIAYGGWLTGEMGSVSADEQATRVEGYDGGYGYAILDTWVDDARGGVMMVGLDIYGGLDNPALKPGLHATYTWDDWGSLNDGGLHVDALGCSGETEDVWQFDELASSTTIDVSEDTQHEGALLVTYTAEFGDSGATAGGHVSFQPRDLPE